MSLKRFAFLGDVVRQKPLLVACISAIAACLLATGYLGQREADILSVADPVAVVVAAGDIQAGEVIDDASVEETKVPRKFVQPGALSSIAAAAGRIASVPIRVGSALTAANARRASESPGVAGLIPLGKRAVSIPLDDASGAAGLVRPGDLVDVMATFDLGADAAARRTTITVIEGILVLAVGSEVADSGVTPKARAPKGGGMFGGIAPAFSRQGQASITLAATPAQAQALAFAKESGAIGISIRAKGDEGTGEGTAPTTIATITGGHDELAPMRRSYREYRGR